jgi:hypothetical protein
MGAEARFTVIKSLQVLALCPQGVCCATTLPLPCFGESSHIASLRN